MKRENIISNNNNSTPVITHLKAITEFRKPSSWFQKSSHRRHRKPKIKLIEPIIGDQKEIMKRRKLVTGIRKPVIETRKAVKEITQSLSKINKLIINARKPMVKNRKPVFIKVRKPVIEVSYQELTSESQQ